jgi:hypothetical protein
MANVGNLFVNIGADTVPLARSLDKAKSMLKGMGGAVSSGGKGLLAGAIMGGGAAVAMAAINAAGAAVRGIGSAISESSTRGADLNETLSKTGVLMGEATADAVKFATELQSSGQGQMKDILESITGSAMAMKGLGTETGKAIETAKQLEARVGDIASQDNIDPAKIRADLQSAFAGELQVMRKYKVFLDADSLKATGLPMGEAIAQGIMQQTQRAKGDFANTRLSTSNMQRTNTNSIETMMTKFGQAIQPVTQAFAYLQSVILSAIGGAGFEGFTGFIDQMRNTIIDMADGLAAAVVGVIIPLGQGLMTVGGWFMSVLSSVGGFFRDAIIGFGGFQGIFGRMGVELAYRLAQGIDLIMQPFRFIAKQLGISLGEGMTGIVASLGQRREQMDQEAGDKIAEANAKRDADKAALSAALKLDIPTGKGAIDEMPGKAMPSDKGKDKDKGPQRTAFSALLNNAQGEDRKQTDLLGQIAANTDLKNLNADNAKAKLMENPSISKEDSLKSKLMENLGTLPNADNFKAKLMENPSISKEDSLKSKLMENLGTLPNADNFKAKLMENPSILKEDSLKSKLMENLGTLPNADNFKAGLVNKSGLSQEDPAKSKLMNNSLSPPEGPANTSAKTALMNGKSSETTGTPATDETLKMIAQLIATALGGSRTGAMDMATKKPGPDRSPQLVGAY